MSSFLGKGMLPMWGIHDQVPLRANMTTSYTVAGRHGIAEAGVSLAGGVFDALKSPKDDPEYLDAVDRLEPSRLATAAFTAVCALPQWEEEPTTREGMEDRHRLLIDVAAANPTRSSRDVRKCVGAVVAEQADRLRSAVRKVFDREFDRVTGAVDQAETRIAGFGPPEYAHKKLTKLRAILQTLHELSLHRNSLTEEAFQRVVGAILQRARTLCNEASLEVISEKAWSAFEREKKGLDGFFREIEQRVSRLGQKVEGVEQVLHEEEQRIQRDLQDLESSVALHLPGPTKEEIISGIRTTVSCQDEVSLNAALAQKFSSRVRDHAVEHCTHIDVQKASIPDLLLEIPAETLAELFQRLIHDSLGAGHSLFELIAREGVEKTVDELWRRAAPTCFFSGRDDQKFGLSISGLCIVRLPKASSAEDEKIRKEFLRPFEQLNEPCLIDEVSDEDHLIAVTRLLGGYAIGIEHTGHPLLFDYVQAGDHGHPPHLVGFVPDAPLGHVSPAYQHLCDHLVPNDKEISDADHDTNGQQRRNEPQP